MVTEISENKINTAFFDKISDKVDICQENILSGVVRFFNNLSIAQNFDNDEKNSLFNGGEGEHVLLAFDSGWYAVGKEIKENFGNDRDIVAFCLTDGDPYEDSAEKMLLSVKNPRSLIVIGNENLALKAMTILKDIPICFVATDFDFCLILSDMIKSGNKNNMLIADSDRLKNISKSRIFSGAKSVLSKKILFVEICVNRLIDGLNEFSDTKICLERGQYFLKVFFNSHDIKDLITAQIYSSFALAFCDLGYIPAIAAYLLEKQGSFCEKGESEYLVCKMLIRLYRLYISENHDYIIKNGGINQTAILKEILKPSKNEDFKYENIDFTDERLNEIKKILVGDKDIIKLLDSFENDFDTECEELKKLYAGKKYTVENYSKKQRIAALKSSPFLTTGFCLLKLIFSDGILEYME